MKSPEYVRDVTRIWRRLIDEHRGADAREMAALAEIFSRGGLTDGYFKKNINSSMLGTRSEGDKQKSRELEPFSGIERKVPIELSVKIKAGEPISLTLKPFDVTVFGDIPEAAKTAPVDRDTVLRNISKLGGTPYSAQKIDIDLDDGLMVPISAINRLRRSAIEALTKNKRSEADFCPDALIKKSAPMKSSTKRSAVFYRPDVITEAARDYFDVIYTPVHLYDGQSNGVLMPAVIFDSERDEVEQMLKKATELGARHVLVGNVGHFDIVRSVSSELVIHADYRMNVANAKAADEVFSLGALDVIVSPELTLPQIRDIGGDRLAIVYGKVPLMTLEKCVMREISDCKSCESGKAGYLTDRKGVRFLVLREYKHRSLVFNSVPVYMADRKDLLRKYKVTGEHFVFTDETAKDVDKIIGAYSRGLSARNLQIRRISG